MGREQVTETRPVCDLRGCGKRGRYGQMMPWPHSGWVTVTVSSSDRFPTQHLDFCCISHAAAHLERMLPSEPIQAGAA